MTYERSDDCGVRTASQKVSNGLAGGHPLKPEERQNLVGWTVRNLRTQNR